MAMFKTGTPAIFEVGQPYERRQFFRRADERFGRGDQCGLCGLVMRAGNNSNNALAEVQHLARHVRAGLLAAHTATGQRAWKVLREVEDAELIGAIARTRPNG